MTTQTIKRIIGVAALIVLAIGGLAFAQEVIPPPFTDGDLDFENLPLVEGISLGAALSFLLSLIKRYTGLSGNAVVALLTILVAAYVFVNAFLGVSDGDILARVIVSMQSVGYFVIGNQGFYLWLGHKLESKPEA